MSNLYPNAGDDYDTTFYPEESEDRQEAERQQKAVIAASYPVMKDVAEWFESQIQATDSLSNIQLQSITVGGIAHERKVSIEGQILAHQLLKELLEAKYQDFKQFRGEADD